MPPSFYVEKLFKRLFKKISNYQALRMAKTSSGFSRLFEGVFSVKTLKNSKKYGVSSFKQVSLDRKNFAANALT